MGTAMYANAQAQAEAQSSGGDQGSSDDGEATGDDVVDAELVDESDGEGAQK
jgi:hypothetical protein